jgi:2'-5' RNA ligase
MARLFVAVDFPAEVISALEQCQPIPRPGVRLTAPEHLHLTLHFLGDASTERMAVALLSLRMEPFSVTVRGVGAFSGKNRTTILWAGIEESPDLLKLHLRVADALATAGYRQETRPFSTHITVARCGPNVDPRIVRTFLTDHADLRLPEIWIDRVRLYSSVLTDKGSKYQCEQEVELTVGPL